ncbi:MAG: hypothetical protein Q8N99_07985 [Nanoarchaeota archaeon]|nr:hypothetical protein [Nanoarchaeota archaeon]
MNLINKKIIGILISLMIIITAINFVFAQVQTWPAYNTCCEKTKNGAWCQNTFKENCDKSPDSVSGKAYRDSPTSCDSTSFCKLGCCVDSEEGICMENSPQRVCQESTGTWLDDSKCNVPQCSLGCCVLGDQASFVTLTRCKRISNIYGLKTNFRKDIKKESECILLAYSQDKGACVYEVENQKTCMLTTRAECDNSGKSEKSSNITSGTEFFKDYLCSADELGTNCGPTTETICVEGKDEIYFKDSCGNPANIYDSNRIYSKDPLYWKKIIPKSQACNYNNKDGNKNSKSCGNCNYLQGSICGNGEANFGDKICKDLNCYKTENGNDYKNGESWCIYNSETGQGQDTVGSRHFRHVCIQGEETTEPCADFRNEICLQQKVNTVYGSFIEGACRTNRWKDCIDQITQKKCENTDKRDCYWIEGMHYDGAGQKKNSGNQSFSGGTTSTTTQTNPNGTGIVNGEGICLPNYPPGLKFWESGDASSVCSLGNSQQIIEYNTNIFNSKSCKNNCEVLENSWIDKMNKVCSSLGDCGAKANIAGKYTEDAVLVKDNGNVKVMNGILTDVKGGSENRVNWRNSDYDYDYK